MYLKQIPSKSNPKFEVCAGDQVVIGIKIDPQMQTVRVTYKENRRVFFVVEEKYKKTHVTTLLNEYSQPLGSLIKDKSNNSGEIEIEDVKLRYELTDRSGAEEINLFEINNPVAALNCKIENEALLSIADNINYLLLSLSWVAFLVKEEKESFQFA
jgi:hypothetical protein